MKRLITSLLLALGILFAPVAAGAFTSQYWELNMYNPAATTDRKINIAYHVFSSTKTDTFKVELFQDITKVAESDITHEYGNSGAFTVDLPASGTYTYKTVATNNADATTKEESRIVQVVDGPAPTVTTVFVNTAAAGGAGGAGGGAAAAPAAGQVAGAAVGEAGQVTDQAATTGSKDNKGVLGAETAADNKKSNNNRNWYIGGGIVVALGAGAAYYVLRMRRANEL
jgi:hypothetical protein